MKPALEDCQIQMNNHISVDPFFKTSETVLKIHEEVLPKQEDVRPAFEVKLEKNSK